MFWSRRSTRPIPLLYRKILWGWSISTCHFELWHNNPSGNKTSLRRRSDVSLSLRPNDVAGTSQMKHPTTSQWNVFTTSYWCVVTTSQRNVMTPSHQYVSTTSQIRLKWNTKQRLSGTSPRLLSGTYPRRPISTFCDVSCSSQMKYPITSVWYVSTTSPSYAVATPCLFYCVYYVFQITLSWPPSGRFSRLI